MGWLSDAAGDGVTPSTRLSGLSSAWTPQPARNLGKQFTQLAMFHTASELADDSNFRHADRAAYFSPQEMWEGKLHESKGPRDLLNHGSGVYNSVKQHGVLAPVPVTHGADKPLVSDGHHRIAAAKDINPDMLIPVEHFDDTDTGNYWQARYGSHRKKYSVDY